MQKSFANKQVSTGARLPSRMMSSRTIRGRCSRQAVVVQATLAVRPAGISIELYNALESVRSLSNLAIRPEAPEL